MHVCPNCVAAAVATAQSLPSWGPGMLAFLPTKKRWAVGLAGLAFVCIILGLS